MVKDKWGLYITHLKSMLNDKRFPSSEQARIKGYLKTWNSAKMLLMVSFFIDFLTIPSILSLAFQKDDINPVDSVRCMAKTMGV